MKPAVRPGDLLEELGICQPEDIDVEAIAQFCGATVLYEPLEGCAAQIVASGERALITVKEGAPRARQRFSVAHELGHWMRDRGAVSGFGCTETSFLSEWAREGKSNPERRANRYAADLLLPERLFKPDARNREMTFVTAGELADRYQTSLTATAIQLVELGSFPAMLVCTEAGRRKWFARGVDVQQLWPVDELHRESAAYELFQTAPGSVGPIEVAADLWIDHPDASRYTLWEDSRKIGGFVLSLLWWKDQRQIVDLMSSAEEAPGAD